ncbi:40S ribosomal protein S12 [Boothiomyces macroporosus]|uniref:40S ribosomal protein S12 n=1 Tax=Boothiomyces macroporosus TaxID=261099 RepID=A0AAD5UAW2_9FUNG|nr:40S ribosomal protein S12 [Boothiomyces macroporosus]
MSAHDEEDLILVSTAGDDVAVEVQADTTQGTLTVEEALKQVLKKALINDGLSRGIRECVKALDRRQAQLCVLVETCTEKEYLKLVEALCVEHNINLIKLDDAKKLGEWAGLCKIDREGNARKVVGASVVVVRDYGEDSEAMNVLLEYFRTR